MYALQANGKPKVVHTLDDAQELATTSGSGFDVIDDKQRLVAQMAPNPEATQVMPWYKAKVARAGLLV